MSKKCELTGVSVVSGNNVSHSHKKTKRRFVPNLKAVSLKSDALGTKITLKVAVKTLRTINKYGNLDSFLVNFRANRLSDIAKSLRKKVKDRLVEKDEINNVKIKSRKVSSVDNAKKISARKAKLAKKKAA